MATNNSVRLKKVMNSYTKLADSQPTISLYRQRGAGHGWMLVTIGVVVGFVLGFILFLSRLPEEHYTLVETERAVEEYTATDASQFGFYDNLPGVRDAVPNVEADQMPAFRRSGGTGRYGAAQNERPAAVQIADELNNIQGVEPVAVKPLETASVVGAVATAANTTGTATARVQVAERRASSTSATKARQVREPTVVRKIPNAPSTFYYLQAGAFFNDGDARRMKSRLVNSGMDAFIRVSQKDGRPLHRVRIGPFYDTESLRQAQSRLGQSGLGYLVIKVQS